MKNTGRFYVKVKGRLFCVEPVSKYADRNADRDNGMKNYPIGGAVHFEDSIVKEGKRFKNVVTLGKGVSPIGYIENLIAAETAR